jgi:hypothetical protein
MEILKIIEDNGKDVLKYSHESFVRTRAAGKAKAVTTAVTDRSAAMILHAFDERKARLPDLE